MFQSMIDLLVLGLASYRLSSLVSLEEGPFSMFIKLRAELGAYDYNAQGKARSAVGRGISCPYCVGVYMAALLYVAYKVRWLKPIIHVFAIAGIQAAFQDRSGS